jgi:hypothetical protein
MAMGVDEARHDDRVPRIDYLGVRGLEPRPDRRNFFALDQHIALSEITNLAVETDDGPAAEQNTMLRTDRRLLLEAGHHCGLGWLSRHRARCRRNARSHDCASVQRIAPRHAIIPLHGVLPVAF